MPKVDIPVGHIALEFGERFDQKFSTEQARVLPEGHLVFWVQKKIEEEKSNVKPPDFGLSEVEAAQYPGGHFI